ncbi:histone-like nucleoid-structuring protein Lsr2 [Cryptosporangium phraense]|uniref:Lsr2 family protein n=1 Tax=Cryptosporangium phraense TaxID=2593070 RepID=A0A545AF57_9ACTN|nr:Lsr2 family protein [Cryptosporangium phraense]TQS39954.1 Lsr2 family protein [Cryptosporangium phraense]
MARRVEVRLVDDLDGGDAEETVAFAVDGTVYEIDLSSANAGLLRNGLAKYVAAARRTARTTAAAKSSRRNSSRSAPKTVADRLQNQAIREWAKVRGLQVNERGRIPTEIAEKYHAAQ